MAALSHDWRPAGARPDDDPIERCATCGAFRRIVPGIVEVIGDEERIAEQYRLPDPRARWADRPIPCLTEGHSAEVKHLPWLMSFGDLVLLRASGLVACAHLVDQGPMGFELLLETTLDNVRRLCDELVERFGVSFPQGRVAHRKPQDLEEVADRLRALYSLHGVLPCGPRKEIQVSITFGIPIQQPETMEV